MVNHGEWKDIYRAGDGDSLCKISPDGKFLLIIERMSTAFGVNTSIRLEQLSEED
jgi:hypothetical protein